jgi:hypothetical protein
MDGERWAQKKMPFGILFESNTLMLAFMRCGGECGWRSV